MDNTKTMLIFVFFLVDDLGKLRKMFKFGINNSNNTYTRTVYPEYGRMGRIMSTNEYESALTGLSDNWVIKVHWSLES